MPKQAEIYNRNSWRVVSHGNGWAYLLIDDENASFIWFQDDDAREFSSQVMDDDGYFNDDCEERFADYGELLVPHL